MTILGLWAAVEETGTLQSTTLQLESAKFMAEKGRPLRIAVDASIVICGTIEATRKAANNGGMNHPTRTLMTHVLNDLLDGLQAVYVFDGPGRPEVKRHARRPNPQPAPRYEPPAAPSCRSEGEVQAEYGLHHVTNLVKRVIDLLGVARWDAPGEAEAECVALERAGIVDAVLTTDGDALAFGGKWILRFGKDPKTGHSTIARARVQRVSTADLAANGLSSAACTLLALLAGGDYATGLRSCGPLTALRIVKESRAAAALCSILKSSTRPEIKAGMINGWRTSQGSRFRNEVRIISSAVTNAIPPDFPNKRVLELYMQPLVSGTEQLEKLNSTLWQPRYATLTELRAFTAAMFGWQGRERAKQFLHRVSPGLLAQQLLNAGYQKTDISCKVKQATAIRHRASSKDKVSIIKVQYDALAIAPIAYLDEPIKPGFEWPPGAGGKHDPFELYEEPIPEFLVKFGAPSCLLTADTPKPKGKRPASESARNGAAKKPRGRPKTAGAEVQKGKRPAGESAGNGIVKKARGGPRAALAEVSSGRVEQNASAPSFVSMNGKRGSREMIVLDLTDV